MGQYTRLLVQRPDSADKMINMQASSCGSSAEPDKRSLYTDCTSQFSSVRVRSPSLGREGTRPRPTVAVPDIDDLRRTWGRSGFPWNRYVRPGDAEQSCHLNHWQRCLGGSSDPCGVWASGPDLRWSGNPYCAGYVRMPVDKDFRVLPPPPPPKPSRPTSFRRIGDFFLGRKVLRNHVVREAVGVLPLDERPGKAGKLTLVDVKWKPYHIRDGYFPRCGQKVEADLADVNPLQRVHWAAPGGSALESLKKAERVKVDPGLRRGSEAPAGARLRQRARWVLGLNPDKQRKWLSGLLSGRWTPDLSEEFAHPAAASLVAARRGAVKFLGGGTLTIPAAEGKENTTLAYVNAVHEGRAFRLFPELLAKLSLYASFRLRGPALVLALRTRATEWCKLQGIPTELAAETLSPSVALAFFPTVQEEIGQDILREGASSVGASPVAEGWWNAAA